MKKKIIPDPLLMVITIIVITGFQVYWLKDNYKRESKALQIKTNILFQQTVHELASDKLNLPFPFSNNPAKKQKTNYFFDENINDSGSLYRQNVVTFINNIRNKINDSAKYDTAYNTSRIYIKGDTQRIKKDSIHLKFEKLADSGNHIFKVLYKVDSLQDSIKVSEIISRYSATLKKESIPVSFDIIRKPCAETDEQDISKAVVGFAHPVTYQLILVSTRDFLLKKMRAPILFSLFLAGVTILSFVLLYRNLLRQHRLAELKNEFMSNITHELKTPIATVGVAIEALKNFNAMHDLKKTKEYLTISSNELQRLSLLVDKVLKLAMFEKKEIELNKEPFDFKELLQEVLDTMAPQFEKFKAAVSFNSTGDNFIIKADKLHITSVIYNLLDNALKYSREDLTISVQLTRQQNIFELRVTDNGIGIPKEYSRKVFDKFFRVPTGNKHAVKGYGLGLSYVSEIIKRHLGYIIVESVPGKGSSFIAKIPMEEADMIWFDDKRRVSRKTIYLGAKKRK